MKNFLKSKKVFLLSLIIPTLILAWTYLNYETKKPSCGNPKAPTVCESFIEYLGSFSGSFQVLYAQIGFLVSLLGISGLYFISNKKHKLGYIFLGLTILILGYVLFVAITI